MNLIEAIKSGRPFKRQGEDSYHRNTDGWIAFVRRHTLPEFNWSAALTAEDWQIQEPSVTITRSQFFTAFADAMKEDIAKKDIVWMGMSGERLKEIPYGDLTQLPIAGLMKRLGFEEQP